MTPSVSRRLTVKCILCCYMWELAYYLWKALVWPHHFIIRISCLTMAALYTI